MDPVIVLVGRPNVGKSTLFNQLTRSRDALVADFPGLTRDRQYGRAEIAGRGIIVVDTAGVGESAEGVYAGMRSQAERAMDEADVLVFMVDARDGLTPADQELVSELRRRDTPVCLAVNKVDGLDERSAGAEFHALGLGEPVLLAAAHGRGVQRLVEAALDRLPEAARAGEIPEEQAPGLRVAVVGRPNVGKSTLVNRILGEERVLVFDQPGTTRDSVFIPFQRDGQDFTLIDTAGVRRRARVSEAVEKFSVIKTLQAIEQADVVIAVVDARNGAGEQDAHLIGHVLEAGRALVLAVNKWDGMDEAARIAARRSLDLKLGFADFGAVRFISALHGTGVGLLLDDCRRANAAAERSLETSEVTRVLQDAVTAHPPPLVRGRRVKLRYAHQGGRKPPVIVVHGNQTERLPAAYRRYLVNTFRKAFDLRGTPLRLEFRTGENPYAGRRNTLTPRQAERRRRLVKHARGRR